jgi:2-methylisocitrate lyase-like PEP mutase family enzyme
MPDTTAQLAAFRALHESGCFVMPNPWDIGSAVYLRSLGFKALATSSAGMGFAHGLPDSCTALPRDLVLAHIAQIVTAARDLPVNADFQAGYAATADGVAESVRLCIKTGVAGLSIEDATGDPDRPLYDLPEALDRLRAARAAIDESKTGVLLTARAECFLVSHPDPLRESLRRLEAYAAAGADVLFAPGVTTRDDIAAVVKAAGPKPVNILMSSNAGLTVANLAAMGVRRISVGSALARGAWSGLRRAVTPLLESGSFTGFEGLMTFGELNSLFTL